MKKKVKAKEQKAELSLHAPKIHIISGQENSTSVAGIRATFIAEVAGALVGKHPDLGGRDNEKIADAAIKLGNLLTERYLNT